MTKIYKIEIKNPELNISMYFETPEAAESTINFYDASVKKGVVLEWECTEIEAYSKQEAFDFLSAAIDDLFKSIQKS